MINTTLRFSGDFVIKNTVKSIVLGSDHAGFAMKEHIKSQLIILGVDVNDVGTHSTEPVDYPLSAAKVARAVQSGAFERGIAICGTGIGASITANRYKGIRAALCITPEMAELSRRHNNANVLVIGGRITTPETVTQILTTWLNTDFEGLRHERRIAMIDEAAVQP